MCYHPAHLDTQPVALSRRRCGSHGLFFQSNGHYGRYLCPLCLACQWWWASDRGADAAEVNKKLYGWTVRVKTQDNRVSAWAWRRLRTRLRRFAVDSRLPAAHHLELEDLVRRIGSSAEAVMDSLQDYENQGLTRSGRKR